MATNSSRSAAVTWNPAAGFNGTKGGEVGKGAPIIGALGRDAERHVENITFQDATASGNGTIAQSCNGITIAPHAPKQCNGGGNGASNPLSVGAAYAC